MLIVSNEREKESRQKIPAGPKNFSVDSFSSLTISNKFDGVCCMYGCVIWRTTIIYGGYGHKNDIVHPIKEYLCNFL